MFAKKPSRARIAVLFAVLTVGCMALFFNLYEPWTPIGPELLPDGSFSTPAATNGWTGWSPHAQVSPDGGYNGTPGVILTTSTNQRGLLRYYIHDLSNIPAFRVSLRAVAEGVTADKKSYRYPRAAFFYRADHNKPFFNLPHEFFGTQKDCGWRCYKGFFPVPITATNVQFYIHNAGITGVMRVDDLSVIPVRPRPSAPWWKLFFGAIWTVTFGLCLFALRPWTRRHGRLILLTVLLILTGILLPKSFLNETIQKTIQPVEKLVQQQTKPAPADTPVPGRPGTPEPAKSKEDLAVELIEAGVEWVYTIGHLTMFSLLAFLSALSWLAERPLLKRAGLVFAGLVLFAAATEVLQFITVDRSAGLYDLCVDLTGMAVATGLVILLRRIQRPETGAGRIRIRDGI